MGFFSLEEEAQGSFLRYPSRTFGTPRPGSQTPKTPATAGVGQQ